MKLVLAILSAFLLAQEPQTPPESTGVVRGIVVNLSTGAALPDATITLISSEAGNLTTKTGRDGRFEFNGLAPRRVSILAALPGFNYPATSSPPGLSRSLSLGNGQKLDVRLGLVPAFAISGRVVDDNKQPVPKIPVQLAQKGFAADGSPSLTATPGYGMTDERGEFRISNVIPGEYVVVSNRDGFTTYYPGVRFPDQAVPVAVSDSDVAGISFPLLTGSKYTIRFRLSGVTPTPKDISVQLPSRIPDGAIIPPFKTIPTTESGVYTFEDIKPGSYRLMIHWYEEQPPDAPVNPLTRMARTIPFEIVDRDVDLGTIEVENRVSLEGRITFKGMDPFRVNIILAPRGQLASSLTSGFWVGENNTFSISDIPEGRYTVRTSFLPENRYLASAIYNGVDVLGREISIDGVSDGKLDIVLDGPAGNVIGVVHDAKGDPFPGATVVLLPPPDRRDGVDFSSTTMTDNDGTFSFANVAPENYSLFAWGYVPQNAYRNTEWLKQYGTLATQVTVAKGRTENLNLHLIPQKR